MNGYSYTGPYEGQGGDEANNDMMMMVGQDANMVGQSLDEIVNQQAKNFRRQSMPAQYSNNTTNSNGGNMDADMRRVSMMDYPGASPAGSMVGYGFDPSLVPINPNDMITSPIHPQMPARADQSRRPSSQDLSLNTSFSNIPQHYGAMVGSNSVYSATQPQSAMEMNLASPYIDPGMSMTVDYNMEQTLDDNVATDSINMGLYSQQVQSTHMISSPMNTTPIHNSTNTNNQNALRTQAANGNAAQYGQTLNNNHLRSLSRSHSIHASDMSSPAHSASIGHRTPANLQHMNNQGTPHRSTPQHHTQLTSPQHAQFSSSRGSNQLHQSVTNQNLSSQTQPQQQAQQPQSRLQQQSQTQQQQPSTQNAGFPGQPQNPVPGSQQDRGMHGSNAKSQSDLNSQPHTSGYNPNNQNFAWDAPEGGWPSTMVGRPHMQSTFKNAYSSTGFDMLGVLMRVATRPNPEINIGAVDLSCAFVVCDAEKDDFPIVYCSENFERLTGYTKHMILGRNCRFLQSPDGNVAPGLKRKYVDDNSVLYLKNMINLRREAQISLINYRRGGQPFMNLLTMIPITWATDQVKFFVGFQVDLVEQPNAVTNKNADGSYSINYQRGMTMPRYVVNPPDASQKADLGQTVPRDDVSAILTTIGSGESEYAKRMWDKVLLENTDDVVHVLSLKGLFQWMSPSALRVLEYEPSEIIGTALSSVCHPSDIVPVTRELKDTSTGASVNVVFRIRRKNSGYMWFEGHGSLHTEQGKGRKSIIMVGRERPVYTLSKSEIVSAGGIGENELWTKMSTAGMFLFVSSNVRQLLDRQPEELVGISIQSLMRSESKGEFARILEHARVGRKASVKHEMINRRGQVLSAFTTLYPGDATEGQKPTFIVAQTRLIKFTRGNQPSRPQVYGKNERTSNESVATIDQAKGLHGSETPASGASGTRYVNTDGAAATFAGQNGLVLGSQDQSIASEDNLFDELKTTKSSSWQYEIRQLEKKNRMLAEEVQALIAAKKKRKRRKGAGNLQKDCANCHTKVTPEWRRGPSGQRDLCNSCGLRWAKLNGRVSPRTNSQHSVHSGGAASDKASKASASPRQASVGGTAGSYKMESPSQLPQAQSNVATPGQRSLEGHAANMEGAHGVPAKIEEGVEPD